MPKIVIGTSILLLTLCLLFGFLNTNKVKTLRSALVTTTSAQQLAERSRLASERKLKSHGADLVAAQGKVTAAKAEAKAATADLRKAQNGRAELAAKLRQSESQIADLQKRVAEATVGAAAGAPGAASNDRKSELDDMKQQLQAAEGEKAILADKVQAAQDRIAAMEAQQKRRRPGTSSPGVHGTILAVNQAYNFVVLSIGDRQGVEANSELLVLRAGSFIGKVRISSVEPTTSIGDIVSNSLARGVQVQPGDTVVYAGSNNS